MSMFEEGKKTLILTYEVDLSIFSTIITFINTIYEKKL